MSEENLFAMEVVGNVLPFKANSYVIEELIDWNKVPDDPIYVLTFPQKGMLRPEHFDQMATLLSDNRITSYNVCYTKLLRSCVMLCRYHFFLCIESCFERLLNQIPSPGLFEVAILVNSPSTQVGGANSYNFV